MHKFSFLIVLCGLWSFEAFNQVRIAEDHANGEQVYLIETKTAKYIYQKSAGGFSNLFDKEGRDWIKFSNKGEETFPQSAAAHFRGLPNLVYKGEDAGVGHPGFHKMISEQVAHHQIRSTSVSGKWQWTWTFFDHYALMTIEKTDTTRTYWFLYEGPIGGKFNPSGHYWGTNTGGPVTEQPDLINNQEHYAHWQSVYFGDETAEEVFFVHQVQPDSLKDLYTYMGNDQALANRSSDGMVVFGFGRDIRATPLLQGNHQFIIGFYSGPISNALEHDQIIRYINHIEP